MLIATWNVNSVKAGSRPSALAQGSLARCGPVPGTKCEDHAFPRQAFEELGYNLALHGQKSYNGIAILSKLPIDEQGRGCPATMATIRPVISRR